MFVLVTFEIDHIPEATMGLLGLNRKLILAFLLLVENSKIEVGNKFRNNLKTVFKIKSFDHNDINLMLSSQFLARCSMLFK
jgi:hypothetical protein